MKIERTLPANSKEELLATAEDVLWHYECTISFFNLHVKQTGLREFYSYDYGEKSATSEAFEEYIKAAGPMLKGYYEALLMYDRFNAIPEEEEVKKISTLYKKDINDLSMVINEVAPENAWVIDGHGTPTRKFDGSAASIINGELHKRYDVRKDKTVPEGAIPCQDKDPITGKQPCWVKCSREAPSDRYFFEAFDLLRDKNDGTYELCGEKINKNREKIVGHKLITHGCEVLPITDFSFDGLRSYLSNPDLDIEGIVFHHVSDGRMCKIRKRDFGFKR